MGGGGRNIRWVLYTNSANSIEKLRGVSDCGGEFAPLLRGCVMECSLRWLGPQTKPNLLTG
jgi:hypothetical protein